MLLMSWSAQHSSKDENWLYVHADAASYTAQSAHGVQLQADKMQRQWLEAGLWHLVHELCAVASLLVQARSTLPPASSARPPQSAPADRAPNVISLALMALDMLCNQSIGMLHCTGLSHLQSVL